MHNETLPESVLLLQLLFELMESLMRWLFSKLKQAMSEWCVLFSSYHKAAQLA